MRYLLDTCVISDFIKSEPGTQTRLRQTPPTDTTNKNSIEFLVYRLRIGDRSRELGKVNVD